MNIANVYCSLILLAGAVCQGSEEKTGKEVRIQLVGDLNSGFYAPSLEFPEMGKTLDFEPESSDDNSSLWVGKGAIERGALLIITDHHPSISASPIYCRQLLPEELNKDLIVIELPKRKQEIEFSFAEGAYKPVYFPINDKVLVCRIRKIDGQGKVQRWMFPTKHGDGIGMRFSATVPCFEQGTYLIDLMDKAETVAGADALHGYAVWTRRVVITEAHEPLKFTIEGCHSSKGK